MNNRKNDILGLIFLGLAPALAATASTMGAFVLALGFMAVLILSSLVMFLLRKAIDDTNARVMTAVIVTTMFSSIFALLTEAFAVKVYDSIGMYISLIAVNMLVIAVSNRVACEKFRFSSLIVLALIYGAVITAVGALREILGAGTFLSMAVPFISSHKIEIFQKAPGAFISAALVLGLVSYILGKTVKEDK